LRLRPNFAPAHFNLGNALIRQGKETEAVPHYLETLRLQPNNAEAHANLAMGLDRQGRNGEVIAHLNEALRIKPAESQFHYQLANALQVEKRSKEAVAHYQEALRLKPDSVLALNNVAWVLATDVDATVRNGAEAVRDAERACELTGRRQAMFLGTLAAAYAESGRFPEAVTTVEKAIELATAAGQNELVATNQKLLELYRAGQPYREPKS
jgi:tetratricopeptide (TPR) repeat protein